MLLFLRRVSYAKSNLYSEFFCGIVYAIAKDEKSRFQGS